MIRHPWQPAPKRKHAGRKLTAILRKQPLAEAAVLFLNLWQPGVAEKLGLRVTLNDAGAP